ncbi:MAG TPA: hypothetical protein VE865_14810 [Bradyrhizobium sp.]|nr:hypothetical protein [Bradyrhizobium sp.]
MNRIVLHHFPTSKLPDEMRGKVNPLSTVTVTVEEETPEKERPTIADIFARRRPPFRSKEEIDAEWRLQRDESE